MSMNSYSYLIYGYQLDRNWLQENGRAGLEDMIGGNPKEKVWFFEDDDRCFVGIPLAWPESSYGVISERSFNISNPETLLKWQYDLEESLKEKKLSKIMINDIAQLHTFHLIL